MEAHIHLRLPDTMKQRLQDAAQARGQTLAEFVKGAAFDRADDVLRQREVEAMLEFLATVPEDDEAYTEEEEQAILDGIAHYREHGGIRHEGLMKRTQRRAASRPSCTAPENKLCIVSSHSRLARLGLVMPITTHSVPCITTL